MTREELNELNKLRGRLYSSSPMERTAALAEILAKLGINPSSLNGFKHGRDLVSRHLYVETLILQATEHGYKKDVRVEVLGRGPGTIEYVQKDGAVRVKLDSGRSQAYGPAALKKL